MDRRDFIKNASLAGIGLLTPKTVLAADFFYDFPVVRTPQSSRKFTSPAIEKAIDAFGKKVKNKELAWMFNNCFPNTLDTTVFLIRKTDKTLLMLLPEISMQCGFVTVVHRCGHI